MLFRKKKKPILDKAIIVMFAWLINHGWKYCWLICYERKILFIGWKNTAYKPSEHDVYPGWPRELESDGLLLFSLFACWFQPAQTSQPTIFFPHNKPAPTSPNQPRNQPANRPIISWPAKRSTATQDCRPSASLMVTCKSLVRWDLKIIKRSTVAKGCASCERVACRRLCETR